MILWGIAEIWYQSFLLSTAFPDANPQPLLSCCKICHKIKSLHSWITSLASSSHLTILALPMPKYQDQHCYWNIDVGANLPPDKNFLLVGAVQPLHHPWSPFLLLKVNRSRSWKIWIEGFTTTISSKDSDFSDWLTQENWGFSLAELVKKEHSGCTGFQQQLSLHSYPQKVSIVAPVATLSLQGFANVDWVGCCLRSKLEWQAKPELRNVANMRDISV